MTDSIELLEEKLQVATADTDRADLLSSLAFAFLYTDTPRALVLGEQARDAALRGDNPALLARSFRVLGACYALSSNYSAATACFNDALKLFEQQKDRRGTADTLTNLATVCIAQGDYAKALKILSRSTKLLETISDPIPSARALYYTGIVHSSTGSYREALDAFSRSLQLYEDAGNNHAKADALLATGIVYRELGNYSKALDYHQQSLQLKETVGDQYGVANALNNIGIVYNDMGDYHESLNYFQQSLRITRALNATRHFAGTLINIASNYDKLGEHVLALEHYNIGVQLCEEIGDRRFYSNGLGGIAETYLHLGEIRSALSFAKRALQLKETLGDKDGIANALLSIGKCHAKLGKVQQAINCFRRSLAIAEELQSNPLIAQAHQLLSEAYKLSGEFACALEHYEKFYLFQREVFRQDFDKKMQNLNLAHDFEIAKSEKEMYRLKAEQMQRELDLKGKHLTTMAMNLVEQNEFLQTLRNELRQIEPVVGKDAQPLLKQTTGRIKRQSRSNDGWKVFEQQFEMLHSGFIHELSKNYPSLSPTELKICALLKLNLSSKDIANLLSVTVRCVETHRYSIRKKMQLPADTNLAVFITGIE